MFKNYVKIAFRNLSRNRFYTAVNILGLAVAIACFLTISMWVKNELSYDRHFPNADRIFRIENSLITNDIPKQMTAADPRLTDTIRKKYPQIQSITRILDMPTLLAYNGKSSYEANAYFADTNFFDVFAFKFIKGDPRTALRKGTVVITDSVAARLFGNEDPIGKIILITNERTGDTTFPRTVTGVFQENESRSHFHPTVIFSKVRNMESFENTYTLFRKGYTPEKFRREIWEPLHKTFVYPEYHGDGNQDLSLRITPLTEIHLTPDAWGDFEHNGNRTTVYIFSAIALFILIIAAINYVNLATAASFSRAREISIRKVLGAYRTQLVAQFLVESIMVALFAAILAVSLVEVSLPLFAKIAGTSFSFHPSTITMICTAAALAIVIGFVSGIYPAFYIASFSREQLLNGAAATDNRAISRKTLVVAQFALSYVALIATLVAAAQMKYVKNKDLGFNKENILVFNIDDPALKENIEPIKNELKKIPGVLAVGASYSLPGEEPAHSHFYYESPQGMKPVMLNAIWADYDYPKVLGLKLLEGPGFDSSMQPRADTTIFAIMNKAAVRAFNWDNPIGKKIRSNPTYGLRNGTCVGVVDDFYAESLHDTLAPLYIIMPKSHSYYVKYGYLSLRIKADDMDRVIAYVKQVYGTFSKQFPFDYFFLKDRIYKQYDKEQQQSQLFNWFSGISLFISCLGLLGLVSFSTKQRDREMAIRKLSGAPISAIIFLLCRDYMKLLLVAFALAIPVGWYFASNWLGRFAYHVTLSWPTFFIAGVIALAVALTTIIIHTIRAANKDPAIVLRHE